MKLTIIETGAPPEGIRSDWPDYSVMFEALLAPHLPGWTYASLALSDGATLPDPSGLDAILITGSAAGVYDDLPWITSLMDFIRKAAQAGIPQVGICFGHQAMAKAFGGSVKKSGKGWGIGRHVYDIVASKPWMGSTPASTFSLGVSHQDQVLSLPPGAQNLAQSRFCAFAALAYPDAKAVSFQGHPEFSAAYSCALYQLRRGTKLPEALVDEACESLRTPVDNDLVGQWIAAFLTEQTD